MFFVANVYKDEDTTMRTYDVVYTTAWRQSPIVAPMADTIILSGRIITVA